MKRRFFGKSSSARYDVHLTGTSGNSDVMTIRMRDGQWDFGTQELRIVGPWEMQELASVLAASLGYRLIPQQAESEWIGEESSN